MNRSEPNAALLEASARLDHNRARVARKRATEGATATPSPPPTAGWPVLWTLVQGVAQHPGAALALASLARSWQQRPPSPSPSPVSAAPPPPTPALLNAALGAARRHPVIVLAGVAVLALAVNRWRSGAQKPPH